MKCKNSHEQPLKPNWSILRACKDFMDQDFRHNLPKIKVYCEIKRIDN